MKVAYFVSMKEKLETFISNEIYLLFKEKFQISIFSTLGKVDNINIRNVNFKINKFSFFSFIINFIFLIFTKPYKILLLFQQSIKNNGLIEFIFAISWYLKIRNKFDLLHASFGDRKLFIAYYLSKLSKIKLSVTIHAHEIYAQPNRKLFIMSMKHASLITTISNKNKYLLSKKYLIDKNKINVVKLPIDTEFWDKKTKINILTVARFTPRKGWYDLLTLAKKISDKFHFIAVGFGDLKLEEEIYKRNLENKITIYRDLNSSQIKKLMEFCDIFFLPSKNNKKEGSEGIPVVLMEAMSMQMKILTTSDGSIEELVEHEIVDPGNISKMLKILNKLGNSKFYKKGYSNRKKVIKLHNINNFKKFKDHIEKTKKK